MEIGREGLRVRQTDATRDVLARAAAASTDDGTFSSCAGESTVPFRILRRACEIARRDAPVEHPGTDGEGRGPWLQDVVRGGGVELVAPSPPARSRALDAKIAQLRREHADREYAAMTRDVSHSRTGTNEPDDGRLKMSALTRDLGFGAHVVTVMFACALGGWFAGEAIVRGFGDDANRDDDSETARAIVKASLAGIGAIGAMTVEALLFMLRDSRT